MLLHAADFVLIDKYKEKLQSTIQNWKQALENYGLRFSKTKLNIYWATFTTDQHPTQLIIFTDSHYLRYINLNIYRCLLQIPALL